MIAGPLTLCGLSGTQGEVRDDDDLVVVLLERAGDGRRNAPSAPRMMVKVLLYAYATGVFSARGIARKLEEDGAFRVLGAGNFPHHRTLCEFRRRHLSDFKELFVAVGRLARAWGLARVGKLSIDGTQVRANASKRKAMSYGRLAKEERRRRGEIEAAAGAAEDARVGAGRAGRRVAGGVAVGGAAAGSGTTPAVGSRTKTGTRRAGSPTRGRMASRTRRRRATSRTRRAGS